MDPFPNGKTPARKLGFLVGELSPKTLAEFGGRSKEQIEPSNKYTLFQLASVAQVTQVMPLTTNSTASIPAVAVIVPEPFMLKAVCRRQAINVSGWGTA